MKMQFDRLGGGQRTWRWREAPQRDQCDDRSRNGDFGSDASHQGNGSGGTLRPVVRHEDITIERPQPEQHRNARKLA